MDLLTTALELHAVSFSPLPVAADGSKRPRIAWKEYAAAALASGTGDHSPATDRLRAPREWGSCVSDRYSRGQ